MDGGIDGVEPEPPHDVREALDDLIRLVICLAVSPHSALTTDQLAGLKLVTGGGDCLLLLRTGGRRSGSSPCRRLLVTTCSLS